jgi:hypothetical protein
MSLLQEIATHLVIPGLPGWTGPLLTLLLALVGIAFLLMPFSVFGMKGRLEAIEAQLDEIQAELRSLTLRVAEAPRRPTTDEWVDLPSRPRPPEEQAARNGPPIPPPAAWPETRGSRTEPRMDWPRG